MWNPYLRDTFFLPHLSPKPQSQQRSSSNPGDRLDRTVIMMNTRITTAINKENGNTTTTLNETTAVRRR